MIFFSRIYLHGPDRIFDGLALRVDPGQVLEDALQEGRVVDDLAVVLLFVNLQALLNVNNLK